MLIPMAKKSPPAYDPISMQILEFILEHKVATEGQLEIYGTFRTIEERLEQLLSSDLLDQYIPKKGRKSVHYILTDRGRACALALAIGHGIYLDKIETEGGNKEKLEEIVRSSSMKYLLDEQ
jgi:hypothetical protein